jgi:hypothetical protein
VDETGRTRGPGAQGEQVVNDIDPQEFGEMRANVRTLMQSMATLAISVQAIEKQLSEAKGGWRMLVWIGGGVGALGSAVGWLLHEFLKR